MLRGSRPGRVEIGMAWEHSSSYNLQQGPSMGLNHRGRLPLDPEKGPAPTFTTVPRPADGRDNRLLGASQFPFFPSSFVKECQVLAGHHVQVAGSFYVRGKYQ